MSDTLDFLVILLPMFAGLFSFVLVGFIIRRKTETLGNFERFVRIFLSEGATLKTWGLFLSAFGILLVLAGVIAKVANDLSWLRDVQVQALRIYFFRDIAIGLEILLSIVLGSFGAVAFKGQGPGGTSFQLSQDPAGTTVASASGPAPADPLKAAT